MIGFCLLWGILLLLSAKKKSQSLYFFTIFFLSILIGFRGLEVGPDTLTYETIFENIGEHNIYTYPEPGWVIFNLIIFKIGGSFHLMLWLSAILILYYISKSIQRYSPNILLSIFLLYSLYFVFYSMNIVRQIVAVSIVLYAYTKLIERKNKLFFIYICLAALFHYTAIITFSIWWIKNIKFSKFKVYLGLLISFIGGFIVISSSILSMILGPYAHYLTSEKNGYRTSIIIPFLLSCFLSVLCLFIYNTSKNKVKESLWMNIYIWGVIINNLLLYLFLGTRVVMYFSITQIILLPMYLYNNTFKQKIFPVFIIICYTSALFFMLLLSGSVGVYPYNNVLFDFY